MTWRRGNKVGLWLDKVRPGNLDYVLPDHVGEGTLNGSFMASEAIMRKVVNRIARAQIFDRVYFECGMTRGVAYPTPSSWYAQDSLNDAYPFFPGDPIRRFKDMLEGEGIKAIPAFACCNAPSSGGYDGVEQPEDWKTSSLVSGFYDVRIEAYRTELSDGIAEVVDRYGFDTVLLDYIRCGAQQTGGALAAVTLAMQDLIDKINAAITGECDIWCWGKYAKWYGQGSDFQAWLENGDVARISNGQYNYYKGDTDAEHEPEHSENAFGWFPTVHTDTPEITGDAAAQIEVMYGANDGPNLAAMVANNGELWKTTLLDHLLAWPNCHQSYYLYNRMEPIMPAMIKRVLYDRPQGVLDYNFYQGDLSGLYYRRYAEATPPGETNLPLLLHVPPMANLRYVSNIGRTDTFNGETTDDIEYTVGQNVTVSADGKTIEPDGGGTAYGARTGAAYAGAAAQPMCVMLEVTPSVNNQVVRHRVFVNGDTGYNQDVTLPNAGEKYWIANRFTPGGVPTTLTLYTYPDYGNNRVGYSLEIHRFAVFHLDNAADLPHEYFQGIGTFAENIKENAVWKTTSNPASISSGIVSFDQPVVALDTSQAGLVVTKDALYGLRGTQMTRDYLNLELDVLPQFAGGDDKGSIIYIAGGYADTLHWWSLTFLQTTNEIRLTRRGDFGFDVATVSMDYSIDDELKIQVVYDGRATGSVLRVKNVNTDEFQSSLGSNGKDSFGYRMVTYLGTYIPGPSANESNFVVKKAAWHARPQRRSQVRSLFKR